MDGRTRKTTAAETTNDALYEEIGRLKVELDWLKKKWECSIEERRLLVDREHPDVSIRRQCELLGVNRSRLYYQPLGESEENLHLMRLLDEHYTRTPFYGSRKMTKWLVDQGFEVNRKRVSRLMELMGIEAIYPKPRLSQAGEGHKIYPYLLKGVGVERADQVWSTDITYIRMAQGFVYLLAVIDWFCNRERAEALPAQFTEPSMKQGVLSLIRDLDDVEILFRLTELNEGRSAAAEAAGLDGAETAMQMKVTPQ